MLKNRNKSVKVGSTRRNSGITTPYPLSQKNNCKNLSVLHAQQCSITSNELHYFPLRICNNVQK